MTQEFYSNGKLLLSGEYAVLDGALAWAMPTKFGQFLRVSPNKSSQISWKSIDEKGDIWFEGIYATNSLKEQSTSNPNISRSLYEILSEAKQLNPSFLKDFSGYDIETVLTFAKDWGLGSSSTLINNVANWAKVDAQKLLRHTFGGSGYDIACAQHNTPILYQIIDGLPSSKEIEVSLPFSNQLYFVYLNKKRNSRDAISAYRKRLIEKVALTSEITQITKTMISSTTIEDFEQLINQHENLLSQALGIPTVKSELFSDYPRAIKSLGGWGGDFILVTGDKNTPTYFKDRAYHIVISFEDMVL